MVKNGFAVDCIGVLQCNVSLCYVSYIALITLDGRGFRVMSLRLSKFVYDIFVRSVKLGGLVPCVLHDVVHQMSCAGDRRSTDTSDPGRFGLETFRYHHTGAEVSRQFGTSAKAFLFMPHHCYHTRTQHHVLRAVFEKWVPYSQRYLVLGLVGLGLPLL